MTKVGARHHDRITQNPEVMVGKPVIRGTRIPVELVLAHLAHNPDLDELFGAYPHVALEDVSAVLAYAHDAVKAERNRGTLMVVAAATSPGRAGPGVGAD